MIQIPFEDVISVYGKTFDNEKYLTVTWNLGTFCNYDCSYCWPNTHSKKYDYKSLGVYQLALDNLVDAAVTANFKEIHISMLGGELTAYKNFVEFIKYINDIKEINFKINLTTNLSPSIKYWENLIEATKNIKLNLTASYHFEFAELNSFLEKTVFIESKKIPLSIGVVMSPSFFDKLIPIAKEIKAKHKNSIFSFQYNNRNDESSSANQEMVLYTQEMIDIVNELNVNDIKKNFVIETKKEKHPIDNGNTLLSMNFINYSGWDCNAGFNSIAVDRQFNVRRCWSGIDKPIGNLKSNFKLERKKCITSACICSADLKIKKTRII
jgi:MoaA/NifB/PqqE/SkfB family radical SAM enzyme